MDKKSSFKGKLVASYKHQREKEVKLQKTDEEKQKLKDAFSKRYNKLKYWQTSKHASMTEFRSFPKELFQRGDLSLPALAVYIVLCVDADFKNESWKQLSLENISKMTGLSVPTVERAITELEYAVYSVTLTNIPLLKRQKTTVSRRTYWEYMPWFIRENMIENYKGEQFLFYTYIVQSGLWSKLDRRAKALYLIMRSTSTFDLLEYCDVEDLDWSDPKEVYRTRKWETCKVPLTELCDMVKMDSSDIYKVKNQLVENNLVLDTEYGHIVYLLPLELYV